MNAVKTFEEFIGDKIPMEGDKKEKPKDEIFLGPDTQNFTDQTGLEDEVGSKYPFGGL